MPTDGKRDMSAAGQREDDLGSSGTIRVLGALAVVTFLILLPGAIVALGASHVAQAGAGNGSGLKTAWEKAVNFVETGLPVGTPWSVNLSGTVHSSTTSTIEFSEIPGVYPFAVIPVAGYVATPSSGDVTVTSCKGATVDITFTPVSVPSSYKVFFNETGLAPGTTWWVDLAGTNTSSSSPSIAFTEVNGTYAFTAPANVSGGAGILFVTALTNGTVVVNGTGITIVVPYSTEYYLTMIATPVGGGNVTPSSGWYAAGSVLALTAIPASGYGLLEWNGSGNGSYSGTNYAPSVTMNSPIVENATFGLFYAVDFQEVGLADGITWSVTFNGVTQSAYLVFLDFTALNGTYPYTVAPIAGYHADSYHGNVTVQGSDVTVIINWVRVTYNVTFVESGLPSGTSWSVTLNGSEVSTTSSSILFVEPNATYSWTVAPVTGYTPDVTGGTLVVNGRAVEVQIEWTAVPGAPSTYTVTFLETGLLVHTAWTVTLNSTSSTTAGSSATSVVFTGVPDGAYQYWVPSIGSYAPTLPHGSVVVSGANVTVDVTFVLPSPPPPSPGSMQISVWDLLILAFISGGGIVVTWLIFRRG
jgi:hypothetical protein